MAQQPPPPINYIQLLPYELAFHILNRSDVPEVLTLRRTIHISVNLPEITSLLKSLIIKIKQMSRSPDTSILRIIRYTMYCGVID